MIETPRLMLRPQTLDDFEASYAMGSDPEVVRFLGGRPMLREEAWNRLLRDEGHWTLFGYGLFAVVEKDGGRFVGQTGLADFHRGLADRFDPFPEAAWVFARAAHGKGYATEAATAAHRWFDERHPNMRTVCIVHPDNVGSIRLAGKLGYRSFGQVDYRQASVTMFEREPP